MTSALAPVMSMAADARTSYRVGRTPGHQHGRAAEQDPVGGRPGDREAAAGHVDAVGEVVGGRTVHAVGGRGRDHHRTGTGAAGPGLPGAALVHPEGHVPRPAPGHELDVDAVRIGPRVVRRLRQQGARVVEGVDERDRVGVAHVDVGGRPGAVTDGDLALAPQPRAAHVDGDGAVVLEGQGLDAVAGADRHRPAGVDEALVGEVPAEHPDAVAAHLRQRAVAVAVVHEPLGLLIATPSTAVRTTRITPSPPMPARRSHSAATRSGVSSPCTVPSWSGSSTKSFSVPWPLRKG